MPLRGAEPPAALAGGERVDDSRCHHFRERIASAESSASTWRRAAGPWESSRPRTVENRFTNYTFRVRATDAAGNTDPTPAKHEWKLRRIR